MSRPISRALTGLLLACLSFPVLAQEVFTLRGVAGFNGCQIHGDNFSGYDKFGVIFGPAVNARISDASSWELGFYFSQKGSRRNPNPRTGDYTYYRIHLDYIDIPLTYKRRVSERYYITLGPSVSYLVSYREESDRGDWTGLWPFNKFVIDLNLGLGGDINESWSVELRTTNAITPARDWGGNFTSRVYYPNAIARFFNKGLYSNILSLFVSYKFDFRGPGA